MANGEGSEYGYRALTTEDVLRLSWERLREIETAIYRRQLAAEEVDSDSTGDPAIMELAGRADRVVAVIQRLNRRVSAAPADAVSTESGTTE